MQTGTLLSAEGLPGPVNRFVREPRDRHAEVRAWAVLPLLLWRPVVSAADVDLDETHHRVEAGGEHNRVQLGLLDAGALPRHRDYLTF
jgi:hypothetical protein